jgi:hypothetical protein
MLKVKAILYMFKTIIYILMARVVRIIIQLKTVCHLLSTKIVLHILSTKIVLHILSTKIVHHIQPAKIIPLLIAIVLLIEETIHQMDMAMRHLIRITRVLNILILNIESYLNHFFVYEKHCFILRNLTK